MDQPSHDQPPDNAGPDPLDAFALVIEAPASERSAAIERICGSDVQLRREVEDLLRHHEDPVQGLREDAVGAIDGGVAGMVAAFMAEPDANGVGAADGAAESATAKPASAASAVAVRAMTRKALFGICAILAIAAAIWGATRIAAWQKLAHESAIAWRKAVAAADAVDCRRFLMQVDPSHRDADWRALLQDIDPVVHRRPLADAGAGAGAAAAEATGRELQFVEAAVAYLPDGVPCYAMGAGSSLQLVGVRTGAVVLGFEANGIVRLPCFDISRTRIAAWGHQPGSATATLWVWEIATCALLCQVDVELVEPVRLRFGPAGRILSWQADHVVQQCSVASGKVRTVARSRVESPSRVFSRGRSWHVDLDYGDNVVAVRRDLREHRALGKHRGTVRTAAFSPDGLRLATACDHTIRVWSLQDGPLETFARGARQVALDDGGRQLLALTGKEVVLLAW